MIITNFYMPLWRNWQTHTTQNRTGNHMGSSPISGIYIIFRKSCFTKKVNNFFLLYFSNYLNICQNRSEVNFLRHIKPDLWKQRNPSLRLKSQIEISLFPEVVCLATKSESKIFSVSPQTCFF